MALKWKEDAPALVSVGVLLSIILAIASLWVKSIVSDEIGVHDDKMTDTIIREHQIIRDDIDRRFSEIRELIYKLSEE